MSQLGIRISNRWECLANTLFHYTGFLEAGYRYLNLDDCWQSESRDHDGNIIVDQYAFPNGIKAVAEYVHSKGNE